MAHWSDVPALIDEYQEKCAAPAWALRHALADVYTSGDVGVYWHPERDQAGLFYRGPAEKFAQDLALAGSAVERVTGEVPEWLGPGNVTHHPWVKVAYSPAFRRGGELLNFLPGEYPGGIPNKPSPLAATLTSGLVGAGLGYGAGWLGEKALPHTWKRGRLRKTLALLGGAGLALPGLAWMYSAYKRGVPLTENRDLNIPRPDQPGFPGPPQQIRHPTWDDVLPKLPGTWEELGERYKNACDGFVKRAWGEPDFTTMGGSDNPFDVNIDTLGHTLWNLGTPAPLTATTLGAVYAASKMPDAGARPGMVTTRQTGMLGAALGGGVKGYATGWLAGKALGLLTGMPPETQTILKNTGAALGIVGAIAPRLLGA